MISKKIQFIRSMIIYVDSGQNNQTQGTSWCRVVDDNSQDLLETHRDILTDFKIEKKKLKSLETFVGIVDFDQTNIQKNNSGELMALVSGLRIALKIGAKKICSDSELMVKWWSLGHVNPKTKKTMSTRKIQLIDECKTLRKEFEKEGGIVVKISGSNNPADLGWHK